jgi:hypothetical protein
MQRRHLILGIAFTATLAASLWVGSADNKEGLVEVIDRMPTREVSQPASDNTAVIMEAPRSWDFDTEKDLFQVPVKPLPKLESAVRPVVVAPPPPTAPPLPFTYIGKMVEENKIVVFVAKMDKHYSLKGGEIIEGLYAVKTIEPQKVVFNYIPLSIEQTLNIGGAN